MEGSSGLVVKFGIAGWVVLEVENVKGAPPPQDSGLGSYALLATGALYRVWQLFTE
jgi:hypothetical protein